MGRQAPCERCQHSFRCRLHSALVEKLFARFSPNEAKIIMPMEKTNRKSSLILGGKSRTIIQSFSTPTRGGPSVFHRALRKFKFRDVAAEIDLSQTISPFLAKIFSFIVCFIFFPPEAGRRSQNTGTFSNFLKGGGKSLRS